MKPCLRRAVPADCPQYLVCKPRIRVHSRLICHQQRGILWMTLTESILSKLLIVSMTSPSSTARSKPGSASYQLLEAIFLSHGHAILVWKWFLGCPDHRTTCTHRRTKKVTHPKAMSFPTSSVDSNSFELHWTPFHSIPFHSIPSCMHSFIGKLYDSIVVVGLYTCLSLYIYMQKNSLSPFRKIPIV